MISSVMKGTKSMHCVMSIGRLVRACTKLSEAAKALATRDHVKGISGLSALSNIQSPLCKTLKLLRVFLLALALSVPAYVSGEAVRYVIARNIAVIPTLITTPSLIIGLLYVDYNALGLKLIA
jgi:hypothetical protein